MNVCRSGARALLLALAVSLAGGGARAQDGATPANCAADAGEACYRQALDLAQQALRARGEKSALDGALGLFHRACVQGLGDACYFAGRIVLAQAYDRAVTRGSATGFGGNARGHGVVDYFSRGCRAARPSAAACNARAFTHAYTGEVGTSPGVILESWTYACEKGSPTACGHTAALLDDWADRGTRLDTRPAKMERTACEGGSPVGCMLVAERVRAVRAAAPGRPAAVPARADTVLRAACRGSLPRACTALGNAYSTSGSHLPRQWDSAVHYYTLACRGPAERARDSSWVGDGPGCAQGGQQLLRRARTSADTTEALRWFDEGCTLLDSGACADLALHGFRTGRVPGHLALFRAVTACNEESGYGCRAAAELYHDPALYDPARAGAYLERGCGLGDGAACRELGQLALDADEHDPAALKLLRRACTLRDGAGCALYGAVVRTLAQQPELERPFVALGCEYGYADACLAMALMAREAGDMVRHGEYRGRACRLDPAMCKQRG